MNLEPKLRELESIYEEIEKKMADPAVASNIREMQDLSKKHSELEEVVSDYRRYKQVQKEIADAKELLGGGDHELAELAKMEIEEKEPQLAQIEEQLRIALLPKDPNDDKDVIMEIRAGTGGDEAALFAADLFEMYSRYAERKHWKMEIMSENQIALGGYKEIVVSISGKDVYGSLRWESGVHRVQRVPVTESSGRIHTSAASVAVLPEAEETDVVIRPEDLRIDVMRAGGHGGQCVNTTDSAVRITHIPTGLVVIQQDEKSQLKNKNKALRVLRARLFDLEESKKNAERAAERKSQVGSGDRSERIRTYNFPQNRITDHRIGLTLYKLDQVIAGDLDQLVVPLKVAAGEKVLESL